MEEKNIPQPDLEQETPTKTDKRRKIFILLTALISFNLFVFGTLYVSLKKNNIENANPSSKVTFLGNSTPTPFPFQELTIPYLRERSYTSLLGELSRVSQNTDYTSYLTSYTSDGFKIFGQLTIPKEDSSASPQNDPSAGSGQAKKYPAIIFVHGYIPPANYQTLVNYAQYVDYLASNGFVVFKIDLRGHGSSEGKPGGSYYSSDYIIDVLNARAALQNSDFVNPDAIGLWGHSMAGNVIARALAASPSIPAIVIWAGAVYTYEDFSEFRIQDSSYQPPSEDSPARQKRNEMFEKYGQFDPNSSFWKQVPMTNYLSDIKGAISLNHAIDDAVVDIRYSRNLNSILENTTIPHELNEYASGGHNLNGAAFNQAMENTVEFFNKYLK